MNAKVLYPRRRAFTLLELLIVLVIIGVLAAILWPVFNRSHGPSKRASCQSNLKRIGLAFVQYTQDYDERMPPIAFNSVSRSVHPFSKPFGWADGLYPYMSSSQLFQCLSNPAPRPRRVDATQIGFTDYWFNTYLAGRASKYFTAPSQTFLCGDGNDGTEKTDARYNRNVLPQSWFDDGNSPARRHLDGADYLFADGHVKLLKAQSFVAGKQSGHYRFRL
jgi:prepilin-type N-terminal cleavage/methylation domain-containing protein/prepilin-type processing-associated H-X9-DG protein